MTCWLFQAIKELISTKSTLISYKTWELTWRRGDPIDDDVDGDGDAILWSFTSRNGV